MIKTKAEFDQMSNEELILYFREREVELKELQNQVSKLQSETNASIGIALGMKENQTVNFPELCSLILKRLDERKQSVSN